MSKRVIAGQLVLLVLLLGVACKGRGLFRPSIESAKPLEIWEEGKPFESAVKIIFEKKEKMQAPAFEKWLTENVKGRRISLSALQAMDINVTKCDWLDKSKCLGTYGIHIGAREGDWASRSPFSLWTDEEKALSIPKKAKISFTGVINNVSTLLGISHVNFELTPVKFEIIQ